MDDKKASAASKPETTAEAQSSSFQLPQHGHNVSSQQNVSSNPDLALHFSHEHQHPHVHHGIRAGQAKEDDVVYSRGYNSEKSNVPTQSPLDSHHQAHHKSTKRDSVSLREDPEKGRVSTESLSADNNHKTEKPSFYPKYKIYFHGLFLALMTGYVPASKFAFLTEQDGGLLA